MNRRTRIERGNSVITRFETAITAQPTSIPIPAGLLQLLNLWDSEKGRDAPWHRLVIEFRLQAARDPALNARYAELHERTLLGVAETLETLFRNASMPMPLPPRLFAQAVLALAMGIELERAADARAFGADDVRVLLGRLAASPSLQGEGS